MTDLEQLLEGNVLNLGMAADELRRSTIPTGVVTYVRVHTITAADLTTTDRVPEAASEVRLYELPLTFEEAVAQVRSLATLAAGRRVAAFSAAEIEDRAADRWGTIDEIFSALVAAGLHDVAEMPVDRLADVAATVAALRRAGGDPQRVNMLHPAGDRKLDILEIVRKVFAAAPTLRRFSPLARVAPVDKPTTGYDDVRMVALARLALRTTSIEVDWSLYGPKLAQVALTFGADHLDAVPASDDTSLGPRRGTIEDVERNIRAAGFVPQEYFPGA